jgi:peptide/nickel transport system ATP-binding protein
VSLLEVNGLHVSFDTPDGSLQAVRDLSFSLEPGRTLGIVGESGSGKSVSMQTIVGLTRSNSARITGQALFEGQDLLTMSPPQLRALRGRRIGMIFQDPLSSLHPYYKIGWQIVELLRAHEHSLSRRTAGSGRSSCWISSGYPSRRDVSTTTRTNSPAACASAS